MRDSANKRGIYILGLDCLRKNICADLNEGIGCAIPQIRGDLYIGIGLFADWIGCGFE